MPVLPNMLDRKNPPERLFLSNGECSRSFVVAFVGRVHRTTERAVRVLAGGADGVVGALAAWGATDGIATHLERTVLCAYQRIRRCGRAAKHLHTAEREVISRGLALGASVQAIARELGRPASTVSREVGRNGGRGAYRAVQADLRRGNGPSARSCASSRNIPACVASWRPNSKPSRLTADCGIAAAAASLRSRLDCVPQNELSHPVCPSAGRAERRRRTRPTDRRGQIRESVSIRERPAEIEDRTIPRHWEGDLITGARHASHLATLVERTTRFVVLVKVNSKDALHLPQRLQRKVGNYQRI